MANKLFPHLERISIKEHAKSNNYEDYIGVVLDKKNNNFKVVEGKFTDKKDMYRKMKARGLILRKAYERKVWEWIEANADGVIISYLMLSTAFSKWRSNNVLHKYYQKLLNDIPELNREREKGNPNTRGGDFITTDDEDAPKRQEEAVELEEDEDDFRYKRLDGDHTVKFIGIKDREKEPIEDYKDSVTIRTGYKTPYNIELLEHISKLLKSKSSKYDEIVATLTDNDGNEVLKKGYDKNTIDSALENYKNIEKSLKTDKSHKLSDSHPEIRCNLKLDGVKFVKEPVILYISSGDKPSNVFNLSDIELDKNGKIADPRIEDLVFKVFNHEISKETGVDQDFIKIQVFIDGNLVKTYTDKTSESSLRRMSSGEKKYDITNTSSIQKQLNNLKDQIKSTTDEEELKKLEFKKDILGFQLNQANREQHNDENNLSGTVQASVANLLGTDNQESRDKLKDNEWLSKYLLELSALTDKEKDSLDTRIKNDIESDRGFINGFYRSVSKNNRSFEPLTTDQIADIYMKIKFGKPVADNDKTRKELLHNLIWYVLSNARDEKLRNKSFKNKKDNVTKYDKISDLQAKHDQIKLDGFNSKTQTGRRDADVRVGDRDKIKQQITNLLNKPDNVYVKSQKREPRNMNKIGAMERGLAGLKKKINYLEDKLRDTSLPEKTYEKINSEKIDLEKQYNDLSQQYNNLTSIDTSKIYSTDGKTVKELDPKEVSIDNSYKVDRYEIPQKEAVQVTQYDNDGAYQLHNHIPYQGTGFNYSAGPIKMTGQIVEDTTKTELNPKLFENGTLIPEVRDALYKIATAFKNYLDLPFEVKDIYFTGSNANYNYTDDSDIDLHLVYDFEQAGVNAELLSKYLVTAKKDFNDKYNIKVKGMPVELGCENISEPLVSTGVYSLGANTWVIKPENAGIEIPDVDINAFNDLSTQIDDTIKAQNASAIENLWKTIRSLRKDSLTDEGEFGMGNMLFKKLRNTNYLDKLRNSMYDTKSKELSLESSEKLQEEELNNKKDYSEYLKDLQDELKSDETQDLLTNKSLISYLDGYKDRSEKRETKEKNGMLNEGSYIPKSILNNMLNHLYNSIPADISKWLLITPDGKSVCKITYDSKNNAIYKSIVERKEVQPGVLNYIVNPETREEITYDELAEILWANKDLDRFKTNPFFQRLKNEWTTDHSSAVNNVANDQISAIRNFKKNQEEKYNVWYNKNKEYFDNFSPKSKALRQSVLNNLFKFGVSSDMDDFDGDKLKSTLDDIQSLCEKTEDERGRIVVGSKDHNEILRIFRAILHTIFPDGDYDNFLEQFLMKPIYEDEVVFNTKTGRKETMRKWWKIYAITDIRDCIEDGKVDLTKIRLNDIVIKMQEVNPDNKNLETTRLNNSRTRDFNLMQFNNILQSNARNISEPNPEEDAVNILKADRSFRPSADKSYDLVPLDFDEFDEYLNNAANAYDVLKSEVVELNKKIKQLDPKKDKKEINEYRRQRDRMLIQMLISRYGSESARLKLGSDEILVKHPSTGEYRKKVPTDGHTKEEIAGRGSRPMDYMKKVERGW